MEDTFREGEEKEEQQDKEKIKEEDNAIEMSEDFDGQMHDGDEREEGRSDRLTAPLCRFHSGLGLPADRLIAPLSGQDDDDSSKEDEEEDELDKKMGDLGDGQTDTLDERMWGDEEDEEDEDASEKEEESGEGMDQVEEHGLQDELLQNSRWLVVLYTSEHVSVCVCHMVSGRVGAGGQRRQRGRRRPQQGQEDGGQRPADGLGGEREDQRAGRPGDLHHTQSRALLRLKKSGMMHVALQFAYMSLNHIKIGE